MKKNKLSKHSEKIINDFKYAVEAVESEGHRGVCETAGLTADENLLIARKKLTDRVRHLEVKCKRLNQQLKMPRIL